MKRNLSSQGCISCPILGMSKLSVAPGPKDHASCASTTKLHALTLSLVPFHLAIFAYTFCKITLCGLHPWRPWSLPGCGYAPPASSSRELSLSLSLSLTPLPLKLRQTLFAADASSCSRSFPAAARQTTYQVSRGP